MTWGKETKNTSIYDWFVTVLLKEGKRDGKEFYAIKISPPVNCAKCQRHTKLYSIMYSSAFLCKKCLDTAAKEAELRLNGKTKDNGKR